MLMELTLLGALKKNQGSHPRQAVLQKSHRRPKQRVLDSRLLANMPPQKTMARVSELSGIPALQVETSIQPHGKVQDYIELQNTLVDTMIKALGKNE